MASRSSVKPLQFLFSRQKPSHLLLVLAKRDLAQMKELLEQVREVCSPALPGDHEGLCTALPLFCHPLMAAAKVHVN